MLTSKWSRIKTSAENPVKGGLPYKLVLESGISARVTVSAYGPSSEGNPKCEATDKVSVAFNDLYSNGATFAKLSFDIDFLPEGADPDNAWIESYSGHWSPTECAPDCLMVDMAPFEPDVNTKAARDPSQIPVLYKRLV